MLCPLRCVGWYPNRPATCEVYDTVTSTYVPDVASAVVASAESARRSARRSNDRLPSARPATRTPPSGRDDRETPPRVLAASARRTRDDDDGDAVRDDGRMMSFAPRARAAD